MKRTEPCVVCETTESSMVHASDPWCCDVCHKKVASGLATTQKDLTVKSYRTWVERLSGKKTGRG